MINVNQKILWLSDYDLDQAPGGAQRSDKIIIDKGKLLGFNMPEVAKTLENIVLSHEIPKVVIGENEMPNLGDESSTS